MTQQLKMSKANQHTNKEKKGLHSLPAQAAVTWPFQPRTELLEVGGKICWSSYM